MYEVKIKNGGTEELISELDVNLYGGDQQDPLLHIHGAAAESLL